MSNCWYKNEFVDFKDLSESTCRFADKNMYRFAITYSYGLLRSIYMETGKSQSSISMSDFRFIDRLKNKVHAPTGIGSSCASVTF